MTSNETLFIKHIRKTGEKASFQQIARALSITSDYARLIGKSLERSGHIRIAGNTCFIVKKELKSIGTRQLKERTKKKVSPQSFLADSPWRKLKTASSDIMPSLKKLNVKSIEEIAMLPLSRFMEETGLDVPGAARIINEARGKLGLIPEK